MGDIDGMTNSNGGLCSMYSMRLKLFVHPGGTVLSSSGPPGSHRSKKG